MKRFAQALFVSLIALVSCISANAATAKSTLDTARLLEPGSLSLLGMGLICLANVIRRKFSRN